MFGAEQTGVISALTAAADKLSTISMVGFVESMNVPVAVATTVAVTIPAVCAAAIKPDYARALARPWLLRPLQPSRRDRAAENGRAEPALAGARRRDAPG